MQPRLQLEQKRRSVLFHRSRDIALHIFFFHIGTFVVQLFPARDGDLDLDDIFSVEVHLQRNDRVPVLFDGGGQFGNLFFVQQQLAASALFVTVVAVRRLEAADMGVEQKGLAAHDLDKTVFEVDTTRTDRLDLAAFEHQPRLERLENLVIVIGFFISGDRFTHRLSFKLIVQ